MTSRYQFWLNASTTDRALGEAMAGLIGADTGDAQTFAKGRPLRATAGSAAVVAWGASVPVTNRAVALVEEFNGAGPWPSLLALGATESLILQAKAALRVEAGPRGLLAGRTLAFWAEGGYSPAPALL